MGMGQNLYLKPEKSHGHHGPRWPSTTLRLGNFVPCLATSWPSAFPRSSKGMDCELSQWSFSVFLHFFCCGGWCFVLFWGVVLVNLGVFCILEVCFCCQRDFNKGIWSEIICRSVGMALSWDALGTKSTIYQHYIILSNIHEPWGTFYMVL